MQLGTDPLTLVLAVTSPNHPITRFCSAPSAQPKNKSLPNREALSLFADDLFWVGAAGTGSAGSRVGGALLVMLVMLLGRRGFGRGGLVGACLSRRGASALS